MADQVGTTPGNYQYEGIGKAGALVIFAWLASTPLVFLTNGILGKFVFFILTRFCAYLAGKGIMILNIAVADIQIVAQKNDFDGSFDEAFKEIHGQRDKLTPEQKKAIDDKVIRAFRKFADFGGVRNG